jgi:hypothetical protein
MGESKEYNGLGRCDRCGLCGPDVVAGLCGRCTEPADADGCDHACGECGRGLPSWQTHGSLCSSCSDEIRREAE